jgi:O-acetyl-ADP-ribose deacetylase (regulator of RNase III)
MIHSLDGDLLLSKAELLAHGVAPNDDWKSGLAMTLRERFPAMHKDFRHFCHQSNPKPGTLWLWQGVDGQGKKVRIANLLTQEGPAHAGGHPGRAKTEYVNHALHELKKLIETEKIGSVALPRLATGVGGLEWAHVEPLIKSQLGTLKANVLLYSKYTAGVAAKEPVAGNAH